MEIYNEKLFILKYIYYFYLNVFYSSIQYLIKNKITKIRNKIKC